MKAAFFALTLVLGTQILVPAKAAAADRLCYVRGFTQAYTAIQIGLGIEKGPVPLAPTLRAWAEEFHHPVRPITAFLLDDAAAHGIRIEAVPG